MPIVCGLIIGSNPVAAKGAGFHQQTASSEIPVYIMAFSRFKYEGYRHKPLDAQLLKISGNMNSG
jgi:hypothetical protein